jgi:hypothetical protein
VAWKPSTWKAVTALVVVAALVLLCVYDLIAYAVGGNDATISRGVLGTADRYRGFAMGVAFLAGVLCGHLFLPQHVAAAPPSPPTPPQQNP